jgi:hypothetical protein
LDRITGKVDRIHWNTAKSDVWDSETGERYIPIDTGNDLGGLLWVLREAINELYEELEWTYENEYLPAPEDWTTPTIGSFVNMNYKFIGKGGSKFTMKSIWQLHMNANGVITAEKYAEYEDCNETE